jgi:hypothetical protein
MNELLFDPETHRKAGLLLGELLANYERDLLNPPAGKSWMSPDFPADHFPS